MSEAIQAFHACWTKVVSRYAASDGTRFDYLSLRGSRRYARLRQAMDELAEVAPPEDRSGRLALFLNLHNALLVEGVVEEGVTRTVRDSRGFQDRARRLGGQQVNARDLAYGLLGGNVRPPYRLRRPFAASDPRAAWIVEPPDPRVRIALIDGTRSGPPLHAYDPHPEALEEGLHAATVAFVNDTGGVMGCPGAGWYGLSPLFTWNARHFGGPAGVREFVASHVASPVFAEGIRSGALKMRLLDYDWGLNKCVVEGSS